MTSENTVGAHQLEGALPYYDEEPEEVEEPDPRLLIPVITTALESFGLLQTDAQVVRVSFILAPSAGDWEASASVDTYKVSPIIPQDDVYLTLLESPEDELLRSITITSNPKPRIGDAYLALLDAVRARLESEALLRSAEVDALTSIVSGIASR